MALLDTPSDRRTEGGNTMAQMTAALTVIRGQGACEAIYNGIRDAEIDRLTRMHTEAEAAWERERKALTDTIASISREADMARRSSLDKLNKQARKGTKQQRRERLRNIPALIVATVLILGERAKVIEFPALDWARSQLLIARRQRIRRDA